ncbi:uncharacterized protein LOC130736305 [Lotus japonicus]|uniref:uncharacterized protein LOC130736305 n=1 Tax=Lotus japonicus TaxID=34305 RepID=UPI00258D5D67|nr:uncharacterized protein LOC130736305 [Lotus japonicus]
MTKAQEQRFSKLLGENLDLFAWSHKDMPRIDPNFICHRLALNPGIKLVTQTRRRMGDEKDKAIQQEVNKLLAADFIREIKYPTWLANVVMVKKANGKWRMCVDYTDLNKACPKDSYPLPSIDKLVDGASGNELLSLMDAYSGYHQIKMHPSDEDKTAFITARVNYCYQTMPFGRKNARATYQRLMDGVFEGQVGRNVEVYVDDMIMKSVLGSSHHEDLTEDFGMLRKHNMRLNPEKCSFGIQGGKFLGFMITSRGIEKNPDKCKAIQEMKIPSSVKEVQRQTGRIETLSSSVILQEVNGEQKIIYFVSHTLQGAEIRYQKIEKAALTVLITARRLRPYFQSFQVKIRTDLALRQLLQKPDLSERLVAWSVELSEYGLQYDKRGKVGAQTLADFVVELTPEGGEKVSTQWILFVDGSSNDNGSGAGVTLQGPGELVLGQSLRFQFKASNNQEEYKALITGLKLATEVKESALMKYLERVRLLMGRLQEVIVEYVPRAQNQRADALASLASTRKLGNNRSVIQETLANPSIEGERQDPPKFTGGTDPDKADLWIQEIEKIFGVLQTAEGAKVGMATYLLLGDADARDEREAHFLTLRQGSMSVPEFASKLESLAKHFQFFTDHVDERYMCKRFVNGLRPDIEDSPGHLAVDCRAPKVEPTINAVKGKRSATRGRVYLMNGEGAEGLAGGERKNEGNLLNNPSDF